MPLTVTVLSAASAPKTTESPVWKAASSPVSPWVLVQDEASFRTSQACEPEVPAQERLTGSLFLKLRVSVLPDVSKLSLLRAVLSYCIPMTAI